MVSNNTGQHFKERTGELSKAFRAYLSASRPLFEFTVECEPKDRIKFIYAVIFPGAGRLSFYGRFLLSRLAQLADYSPLKVFLYRLLGVRIGKDTFISPGTFIDPHFPGLIEIRDNAILGWGVHLFAHDFDGQKYRAGRVVIGEGAVLGAFSAVRDGISVGRNAFVAPGSIVCIDVPDEERFGVKDLARKQRLDPGKTLPGDGS